MHFLCLHGGTSNMDVLKMQLAPLQNNLEADNAVSFHYVNGPVKATAPQGQEFYSFFGSGPHYRWLDYGGIDQETLNNRVRNAPVTPTPEDGIRDLVGSGDGTLIWRNYDDLIKYLDGILDENPDIAGMVGYSEGACMASTYILNEEKRLRETGRERRIKCALFVTGTPPINPDKGFVLADEQEDVMLDVPTLHVIGANDPYRHGSYSLYNICDPDLAEFFDTGKGHTIPRSGLVVEELGDAVRALIERSKGDE